ncbi:hypothetical protein OXR01_13075 [Staphylococcus gallinarum]|uniref:hypothetical protein n=1 Tax=Staphylococcus gallinarum TaxID=1293 RepID=UPI00227F3D29|nr:hypothetical protein [Staphylococcus gallinarum]MDN6414822.1 hypothetical protein [Staphylococcus gallinarum]
MTHLTLHEELYETRIENNKIKAERDTLIDDIAVLRANNKRLERENEKLRNNYNALTDHIRQKAEANPNVDRYIALVNYIDRLEKGDN